MSDLHKSDSDSPYADDLEFVRDYARRNDGYQLVQPVVDFINAHLDPQIIHTPAELEALDGETVVGSKDGYITSATELRLFVRPHNADRYLPAVVLRDGAGVRACWEALEGETT